MPRSIMRAVLDHPVHSLDFVKVTESAALAASRWMGRGERDAADGAAVEKMREALGDMEIAGRIVIGEGERDEAPMLYIGEEVGSGGKEVDIAVDPVEGTNLVANGLPNSIAVMAIAERGGLLHAPDTYMKKLAVGAESRTLRAHRRAGARESRSGRQRAREADQRRLRHHSRSPAPRRADSRSARGGRANSSDLRRRRRRVHRDRDRFDRDSRRDGNRRRARGRARGGRDQVPGRKLHGAARAAQSKTRPTARSRWVLAMSIAFWRSTISCAATT